MGKREACTTLLEDHDDTGEGYNPTAYLRILASEMPDFSPTIPPILKAGVLRVKIILDEKVVFLGSRKAARHGSGSPA
jgi:hypothetical protein